MPREREYGDDLLVSTSVHLRVGTLRTLKKLGIGRSRFIREAVEEKLERDLGLEDSIRRLEAERKNLLGKAKVIAGQIKRLRQEAMSVKQKSLRERRRETIEKAILNVPDYQKPEDVLKDIYDLLDIKNSKEEKFVLALIDEEWREHRGETEA